MKERWHKIKQLIVTTCLVTILLVPTYANALTVNDFIGAVPALLNGAEGPSGVPIAEAVQRTKESCTTIPFIHKCIGPSLDHVAIILLRAVINKLSDYTVAFINNGFQSEGGAGYATDLAGTLTKELDVQAGNIIYGAGVGQLCSPFQTNIRLALIANEAARNAGPQATAGSCSLSKVSNNIQGFLNGDFTSGGGWDAWFTMTQDPNGNPYSAFLNTQAKIDSAQATAVDLKQTQLSWNVGFFSTQDCTEWTDQNVADAQGGGAYVDPFDPANFGSNTANGGQVNNTNNQVTLQKVQQKDSPGPGWVCSQKGPVKTPGTVVQDQLKKVFGSEVDQLNVASNFNQIIAALTGQLEKLVFSKTKGLFANESSNGGNGGTYTSNSTNGATAGGFNGNCSASPTSASADTDKVTWTFTGITSDTQTYAWSGDEGLSGTGVSTSITYSTEGQKNATLVVTDTLADGTKTSNTVACAPVKVTKYPPLAISCTMVVDKTGRADSNMPVGGSATWTVNITGGSGQLHLIDLNEGTSLGVTKDNANSIPPQFNLLAVISPAILSQTFTRTLSTGPVYWFNGGILNGTYIPLPLTPVGGVNTVSFGVLYTQIGNNWGFGFDQIVDEDPNVPPLTSADCSNLKINVTQ